MLRADGIPARFDIGFPLPENKEKGDIAGYHCWAEFYARKIGWIPVDISEGKRRRSKIISSAALMPIACSFLPGAMSHCHLSRMVQP